MNRLIKVTVASFAMFLLSIFPLAAQGEVGNIKCILKGIVKDRPESNRLVLLKEGESMSFTQGISVPINNGEFECTFYCDHEELYQLIFADEDAQGRWRPIKFISEQGVINFTLHPIIQFDMNIVEGGVLNREYSDFEKEGITKQKSLMDELNKKISQLGNDIPDVSSIAKNMQDSLMLELALWTLQNAKDRPNIVGYSIMVHFAEGFKEILNDISPFADVYQTVFALKYPNHPYTAKMINFFTGSSLKAGVPFIDFIAVDMNGRPVKLSDRIVGKPAVLHLWASWCGPCRKNGKELIPVYEEFRDKGFVVIGVAREKSISTAEAAVKLDEYPWENLVELNDAEQIWFKYGIGNAAGSEFLIDEKGIIIAVAPSVEEIKNFLTKMK